MSQGQAICDAWRFHPGVDLSQPPARGWGSRVRRRVDRGQDVLIEDERVLAAVVVRAVVLVATTRWGSSYWKVVATTSEEGARPGGFARTVGQIPRAKSHVDETGFTKWRRRARTDCWTRCRRGRGDWSVTSGRPGIHPRLHSPTGNFPTARTARGGRSRGAKVLMVNCPQ